MATKAFITGITGMVGSHLAEYILAHTDWEVHGLIRWRSPLDNVQNLVPLVNSKKRVFFHYGDLRDSQSIDEAIKNVRPDYVFHLAAQSYPKTSFTAPLDTYETNIQGTTRVLEALKIHAPKAIIHICASSEVFGRVPADKLPIDEECNFHPASPYAISKVGTDLVARYYAEAFGMTVMSTRMFTHTGPRRGDVFAESSFAKQIALAEAQRIPPIIKVGNLKSLRTIADVRDAVRAYFMLVTINPTGGQYYNIGGTHTIEIGELLNDLIGLSPLRESIQIVEDPDRLRPIDADLQVPNTKKFTQHTGWKPEIPYKKTMEDLLNYWRARIQDEKIEFLTR